MHQWEWKIQPQEILGLCLTVSMPLRTTDLPLPWSRSWDSGNPLAHVILRGAVNEYGKNEPNFYYETLLNAIERYEAMGLENPFILIDTNHDNSGKQYMEQIRIVRQTLQNRDWNEKIKKTVRGFMIESYLADGRQNQPEVFGCSITDPCLGWENTEALVEEIYATLTK